MGNLPVLKAVVGKFIQRSSSFLQENVINMAKNLTIRPFARLLTMLGDQLIKNEQIAVIELIKNAYDADADWVKVSFEGFTESLNITPESRIIIEVEPQNIIALFRARRVSADTLCLNWAKLLI